MPGKANFQKNTTLGGVNRLDFEQFRIFVHFHCRIRVLKSHLCNESPNAQFDPGKRIKFRNLTKDPYVGLRAGLNGCLPQTWGRTQKVAKPFVSYGQLCVSMLGPLVPPEISY